MNYQLIKYQNQELYYSKENNEIYLSRKQMIAVFKCGEKTVRRYFNIYGNDNENDQDVTKINSKNDQDKKVIKKLKRTYLYPLELVLEIGQNINSEITENLANWAASILGIEKNSDDNIIIYNNDNLNLEVHISIEEKTVWLTQYQIAELYQTSQQNVSLHISNILENELDVNSVHKFYLYTALDGKTYNVSAYNLDMILAIGYRVKSDRGIKFRNWATKILKEKLEPLFSKDNNSKSDINEMISQLYFKIENLEKDIKNVKDKIPSLSKVFFEGNEFEPMKYVNDIVESAKEIIVVVDSYSDIRTLEMLKNRNKDTNLTLITSTRSRLNKIEIEKYIESYGKMKIVISDDFHDRYLIVDNKDFYHFGSSLNYLGKRFSQVNKIGDEEIIEVIRKKVNKVLEIEEKKI